jgi:hypothetical protein
MALLVGVPDELSTYSNLTLEARAERSREDTRNDFMGDGR